MKWNLDILLIVGMTLCYIAGQYFAADRFAMVAGALLAILAVRLLGSVLTWVIRGR